jgi:ribonuclease P protein component
MRSVGLPREERLRGREAVRRLLHAAGGVENELLVLRHLPNRDEARGRRILIAVGRSCRGAVRRNRLRRRLRTLYRIRREKLPGSGDFLLLGKARAARSSWVELERAFADLAEALGD